MSTDGQATPVLVGGSGRSGTTILAKLIGAHPECHRIGIEVRLLTDRFGLIELLEGKTSLARFKKEMEGPWWHRTLVNGETRGLHKVLQQPALTDALAEFEYDADRDPWGAAELFVHRLLDPLAFRAGASYWVEDTPPNILAAGTLLELMPDARMFNSLRDGRDVACSVVPLIWGPDDVDAALEWWATTVLDAHRATSHLPPAQILVIQMEELVLTRREPTYARILEHLGLPDDPKMRAFFETQVRAEKANVGRWESEIPIGKQPSFTAHYAELQEQLVAAGVRIPAPA